MKEKAVTIKDVAKYSGVSIATVSLILNGNEHKFSPKTVEKVLQAKETLNYQPNYFARQMIVSDSKTIGVMLPDITNPFFAELMVGIEDALYQNNFVSILCNANNDLEKEKIYLKELIRRGIDGFIIGTPTISTQSLKEKLQEKHKPYIIIDQKRVDGFSDSVLSDDFYGGELAAEHLTSLGHKNMAIVMPIDSPEHLQNRLKGFKKVCQEKKIDSIIVVDAPMSNSGGYRAVKQIVTTEVTAIFAINDQTAFGIYRGLEELGKKVPEDYSVIGYDNVETCEYVRPKLTTVAQPIKEIGNATAKLLIQRIKNPNKVPVEEILPVTLISRASACEPQEKR